jgi:hypothetical protein
MGPFLFGDPAPGKGVDTRKPLSKVRTPMQIETKFLSVTPTVGRAFAPGHDYASLCPEVRAMQADALT